MSGSNCTSLKYQVCLTALMGWISIEAASAHSPTTLPGMELMELGKPTSSLVYDRAQMLAVLTQNGAG